MASDPTPHPSGQPAVIFDDGRGRLAPLTDLRAAFDVRTGARTTFQRLVNELDLQPIALVVPPLLAALTAERHDLPANPRFEPTSNDEGVLLVNGRCVLPLAEIGSLEPGQTLVDGESKDIIAHRVAPGGSIAAFFVSLYGGQTPGRPVLHARRILLSRPWHIRTFRDEALSTDLVDMATLSFEPRLPGVTFFGEAPISIATSARLYPGVILDLEHGPIVIDDHAVLRPGCTLIGPCYIGPHTTVADRALIKANTSIGPWCKVAGEVGGTIFQGYANKAHDGHLGDAFVGEWVNLGAGTTNSNLLNTYGEVLARAAPASGVERTGQTFLGCIIGDHVKTAICTRIMTGAVIHTGAMLAATAAVEGAVPAFAWVTDDAPPGARSFRIEKFLDVAKIVMGRRSVTANEAYLERLRLLHAQSSK